MKSSDSQENNTLNEALKLTVKHLLLLKNINIRNPISRFITDKMIYFTDERDSKEVHKRSCTR
jgi:hypothetical protein